MILSNNSKTSAREFRSKQKRHSRKSRLEKRCRRLRIVEQLEARTLLAAIAYESPIHVFSIDDVIGGFDGVTFADTPSIIDLDAEFEDPANPDPPDYDGPVRAITDKEGNVLYP